MYDFHYNTLLKYYSSNVKILCMDTDSLIYETKTPDIYEDIRREGLRDHFDLSNYPPQHPCYCDKNLRLVGKIKDEIGER